MNQKEELNQRQELFCSSVAGGATFTSAAVAAGYSRRSAAVIGSRLAKDASISARIKELSTLASERAFVNAQSLKRLKGSLASADRDVIVVILPGAALTTA